MADVTSTTDWKPGLTVELDGAPHVIVESHHVKPGKGGAYVRAKLKNLETGAQFERTFNAGQKVPAAMIERRDMQFLYEADGAYHMMDTETYEQTHIDAAAIGDARRFLKENMVVIVTTNKGRIIGVELPTSVELEVVETEPGIRGDTVSGANKPAKLETGATVQVPLFVNTGDRIKVDTRTGAYQGRA